MYGYGFSLFLTNRAILAKANAGTPPSNTVAPSVTGSVIVGSTLTTTTGTWMGTPVITYTYQWKRGVSNIAGATNSTYILQAADVGQSIKCIVTATNAFGSAAADSNAIIATWEADAQAFITAAAITDPTQQSAINTLVTDLKGYGLWTKMKAIYPFVGGTASTHKFNLKNTAQYQITWYGGVTHSSNGITGNGTNGYGDTFLNNNVLSQNDNHVSVYVRTSGGNTGNDLASWNGSTFGISMYTNFLGGFTAANNSGGAYFTFTQGTQGGLYINRRISATQFVQQRNLLKQTNNNNSTNHITTSFKLLRTGDFNGEYSNKNLAFASLGDGLNNTEADALVNCVQAFQTLLNRQV